METQFTEQESLKVIKEMIERAKNNFQRGGVEISLLWGYLIAITAIAHFILCRVLDNPSQAYMVWGTMWIGVVVTIFMQRKSNRQAIVKNHIDKTGSYIWWGFAISVFLLYAVFWIMRLPNNGQFLYITPVILGMAGMAEFITAVNYRYKPYYYGAIIFWAGALACAVVTALTKHGEYQSLIMAACAILSFVIPSHVILSKSKGHV